MPLRISHARLAVRVSERDATPAGTETGVCHERDIHVLLVADKRLKYLPQMATITYPVSRSCTATSG
jgi:hypothetical protein